MNEIVKILITFYSISVVVVAGSGKGGEPLHSKSGNTGLGLGLDFNPFSPPKSRRFSLLLGYNI